MSWSTRAGEYQAAVQGCREILSQLDRRTTKEQAAPMEETR